MPAQLPIRILRPECRPRFRAALRLSPAADSSSLPSWPRSPIGCPRSPVGPSVSLARACREVPGAPPTARLAVDRPGPVVAWKRTIQAIGAKHTIRDGEPLDKVTHGPGANQAPSPRQLNPGPRWRIAVIWAPGRAVPTAPWATAAASATLAATTMKSTTTPPSSRVSTV